MIATPCQFAGYASVLTLALLAGCASPPPPTAKDDQQQVVGRIVQSERGSTSDAGSRRLRSSMRLLGDPLYEALFVSADHIKYIVEVDSQRQILIESKERLATGDCVVVTYAKAKADDRYYFGLGDATVNKSDGCRVAQASGSSTLRQEGLSPEVQFAAHAQSPGQPVMPKQQFPNDLLSVYSPDSEGWVVTGAGSNGIAFGKRGTEQNETYGAQVIIFEMPNTGSSEELVGLVKRRIATMNPAPRFQETVSDYQYTEGRGYPCVNVRTAYDDNAAVTAKGREQLKLKVIALYCRHPIRQELGFFAAYSYRGKTADAQIESAAKSFIEATNVPK